MIETSREKIDGRTADRNNDRFHGHLDLAAVPIALLGFGVRLWTASGTFLNPDEALHFYLANQTSLARAYRASLTAAHPPLLTFLLYFWRALGTSELWLRLPSVLAGAVFCWMFYKWLSKTAGGLAGLIGLLFVALLPPIVRIAAEIRQYSLLLAFLASALYFLDEAFAKNSITRMAAFSLCLYLGLMVHYSAFWFAAALGLYALFRVITERPPITLVSAWALGQLGGLALAAFFYITHLSKLGVQQSKTALQGWMSEHYLRRSFFDPAHDNLLKFPVGHTFGVFQYFAGQLAAGDILGLLFFVGVTLLLSGKAFPEDRIASRRLGIFLLLPFAVAIAANFAHLYPYAGTRHIAFLIVPGVAGVSVAIARLSAALSKASPRRSWASGLAIAGLVVAAAVAFGKLRQPTMNRADQSRKNMMAAMQFVRQNMAPSDFIFIDYQTDLILGHYLCRQRPIPFEAAPANFEQFSCDGHRIVSADYKTHWNFSDEDFPQAWQEVTHAYNLKPAQTVWICQTGWGANLPEDLRSHYAEFQNLRFQSFGNNIKIFKLSAGQPMPAPVRFQSSRVSRSGAMKFERTARSH